MMVRAGHQVDGGCACLYCRVALVTEARLDPLYCPERLFKRVIGRWHPIAVWGR